MYKFLIWVPSIILFIVAFGINDKEDQRKKKIAMNMISVSTAISFGILLHGVIFGYINTLLRDYSFMKTTIEIFEVTWWRIPAMIFCILIAFV